MRHMMTRWSGWEKVANLDEGPPMTQCGIELCDLPDGDRIRQVGAVDVDCAACKAPTEAESAADLRVLLESFSTRMPYENTLAWAVRELRRARLELGLEPTDV